MLIGGLWTALAWGAANPADLSDPRAPWVEIRSENFHIVTDADARRNRDIVRDLERFRELLGTLLTIPRAAESRPTMVIVLRNRAEFEAFAAGEGTAGYFLPSYDRNYLVLCAEPPDDFRRVLFHEYTHFFLHNAYATIPLWLDEGLATYFEVTELDSRKARCGLIHNDHVIQLKLGEWSPLDYLFSVSHGSPDYNEGDRQGLFYAQSWILTHYLIEGRFADRGASILGLLDDLALGTGSDTAHARAFPEGGEALARELRAYLEQSRYSATVVNFESKLPDHVAESRPADEILVLSTLAELSAAGPTPDAGMSERLLGRAEGLQPGGLDIVAARAVTLMRADDADSARALLAPVVEANPVSWRPALLLGMVDIEEGFELLGRGSAQGRSRLLKAREHLSQAVNLNPDLLEARCAFARTFIPPGENATEPYRVIVPLSRELPARRDIQALRALYAARKGLLSEARQILDGPLRHAPDTDGLMEFVREEVAKAEGEAPAAPK